MVLVCAGSHCTIYINVHSILHTTIKGRGSKQQRYSWCASRERNQKRQQMLLHAGSHQYIWAVRSEKRLIRLSSYISRRLRALPAPSITSLPGERQQPVAIYILQWTLVQEILYFSPLAHPIPFFPPRKNTQRHSDSKAPYACLMQFFHDPSMVKKNGFNRDKIVTISKNVKFSCIFDQISSAEKEMKKTIEFDPRIDWK